MDYLLNYPGLVLAVGETVVRVVFDGKTLGTINKVHKAEFYLLDNEGELIFNERVNRFLCVADALRFLLNLKVRVV